MPRPSASSVLRQPTAKQISAVRTQAALARWDSVRHERELWLRPFRELPVTRALEYLEDLRKICETAGGIVNQRMGEDTERQRCSGIVAFSENGKGVKYCGKDLSGLKPDGKPKWISKKDSKDPNNPEVWISEYFCSDLCLNNYNRYHGGAMGGTTPGFKTV